MPGALDGRAVIVTGASQGIGEAVAHRFAEEGARLLLTETDTAPEAVASAIHAAHQSVEVVSTATDVTDDASVDALVDLAVERFGGLDVLAHATAVGQRKTPTAELTTAEWDRVLAVNARGPFLLARSALRVLPRPGGAIVFTGSFTGEQGQPERAAYSASKGALRLLTQSLALELARDGIRVNGVAPAFVESELGRVGLRTAATERGITIEQAQQERDAAVPMRRQADAREVADAFVFLASDASSYVTGTWLDVNGGYLLR